MPTVETNTQTIITRLLRDGWVNEGGSKHDKFVHPSKPGIKIMVPRHRTLTPGVARNIAQAAGWL